MTEHSKTWRQSTTTRSWSASSGPPSGLSGGAQASGDGRVHVSEEWSYAGSDQEGAFDVRIKNGAVTVNGRRYDSLDQVPREQRERIEALQQEMGSGSLQDMLRQAGVDISELKQWTGPRNGAEPGTIMGADMSGARDAAPAVRLVSPPDDGMAAAPGEVPRSGIRPWMILLALAGVGMGLLILRLMGVS